MPVFEPFLFFSFHFPFLQFSLQNDVGTLSPFLVLCLNSIASPTNSISLFSFSYLFLPRPVMNAGYWYPPIPMSRFTTIYVSFLRIFMYPPAIDLPSSSQHLLPTLYKMDWYIHIYIGQHELHRVHLCTWRLHASWLHSFSFFFSFQDAFRIHGQAPWSSCICPLHIT